MWSACAKISLDFYGNGSLKEKRKNMSELCKDIQKKYNCSALEIDHFDDPEKCSLGVSLALPSDWSAQKAKSLIQEVCTYIDSHAFTRVVAESWDVYYLE